jgi:hypothetical protein
VEGKGQFTIGYLLALTFWWALTLAIGRAFVAAAADRDYVRIALWLLALPIAAAPAFGGLFLKMGSGFVFGVSMSGVMLLTGLLNSLARLATRGG